MSTTEFRCKLSKSQTNRCIQYCRRCTDCGETIATKPRCAFHLLVEELEPERFYGYQTLTRKRDLCDYCGNAEIPLLEKLL